MKTYKSLNINGTVIDKQELNNHLEKIAVEHSITSKSQKNTYPIPELIENLSSIKQVYNLLNEHLKLGIPIHPAGEWLLDNFYVIEETTNQIKKDLNLKKYINFVGIANGKYKGFARIYVLAQEIVAYTDCKIDKESLIGNLASYQLKKTLNMDEIWNIGIFIQIAIIKKIKEISEKIYETQIQKYKVENIVERLIENKNKNEMKFKNTNLLQKNKFIDMKYPFIEYMSYTLKRYGKKGYSYLKALEGEVEKTGTTVSEVIKKEHFNIAIKKVLMANSITSMKEIQRINFLEMFEELNGVEEVLKHDPACVYDNMSYNTKDYYRSKIKEISKKTRISEIYIAKKVLEIAQSKDKNTKEAHVGYYLIDKGIDELYGKLNWKKNNKFSNNLKTKLYVIWILFASILLSCAMAYLFNLKTPNTWVSIISAIVLLIPTSEIVVQITQYILGKIVKPKLIPKMDFLNGINEENSTMVVIPTIIKSKQKVKELMRKLEVFYLANESDNLYFALLGDCSQSNKKQEDFDKEVEEAGIKQVEILNEKYSKDKKNKFYFIYRERIWNEKENCYLGWERKRGLLNQFNDYMLSKISNPFKVNSFENEEALPKIKYVITLDADTDLVIDSAFELIGAMSHILNKPELNKEESIVQNGYAIMQPRIGVDLEISNKTLFTKIFAGSGGTDSYTNAISDIYQDNFGEGIFTGKGIYDLEIFSKVLGNKIPENTVLSHDLLEGNYLRCGLVSDIMLMDGYPYKYNSFMIRLSRWIRGDWQIKKWIFSKKNNPLNLLSRYKILDNLRRSLLEIFALIVFMALSYNPPLAMGFMIGVIGVPYILEIFNYFIFKKEGEKRSKTFTPQVSGIKGSFIRLIIAISVLPHKAYISLKAIIKTIYRTHFSKKHLLEWTTSEEAEKQSNTDVVSYYKEMFVNIVLAIIVIIFFNNSFNVILAILWIIAPYFMYKISLEKKEKSVKEILNKNNINFIIDIGEKTWKFFETFLNEENNFLIPDNYQEDRRDKVVERTSSTNIGLSLMAVIAAYDLRYIDLKKCIDLLKKIILSIDSLPKWNGHLYNWYNTHNKTPLMPRYVSTVDSGNFVGYLFVVKAFFEKIETKNEDLDNLIEIVKKLIDNTDFSVLYSKENRIFSIGFNIEENKLTDSYYDLLASEARQASLVAIAKKDIPAKHWNSLNRTITTYNNFSGLISWSGTAFEYLMPNINIPKYPGSLLDESCKFMIMCQQEYSKKLKIPWGITESAFNIKDLKSNYQYKAFGIPWLGLKRGLADELVVAPYGSILAIVEKPKEVISNLKILEKYGALDKYGFFEAIDFTPERIEKGKKASIVKTYMAHHQALILLSINNLINNNIFCKRFMQNPEIEVIKILLQERVPETAIVTKEEKEKVEKLKYKDYEDYLHLNYNKIDEKIIRGNVISNNEYTVAINQKGFGFSKLNDIYINRFKVTKDYPQGIFFYIKNIKNKDIWSSTYNQGYDKNNRYQVDFMPDKVQIQTINGNIKTETITTVVPNEPIEIRRLVLENIGTVEETLEVTSFFEPVLSYKEQDYAHPAFNNLFLSINYNEEEKCLVINRKQREEENNNVYVSVGLYTSAETIGDLEYEIDKEKFMGRGNWKAPEMVKNSVPFSKKTGLVTEPVVALKRIVKIKPQEKVNLNMVISANENIEECLKNLSDLKTDESIDNVLELARAKVEAESRYLGIKGKDIEVYQKMLSYILFDNPLKVLNIQKYNNKNHKQSELWKYGISGDLPIILVEIKDLNDAYVITEVLKAYEFFKTKNIEVEIIILNKEKYSYENYVRDEIEAQILNAQMAYLKNIRGGIFSININEIDRKDVEILELVASIIIKSEKGGINNALRELEENYVENYKEVGNEIQETVICEEEENTDIDIITSSQNLKYFNEYGGFSEDGKEYLIRINTNKRLPTVWTHILANKNIGTILTENMGGYTWFKNSRLNRVTTWENDATYDIPSEVIYLKDLDNNKKWSLGLNPMPDNKNYNIIYGLGYVKYIHKSDGILQELQVFVPEEDKAKIQILTLKNTTPNKKIIKLLYYIKPVIGEDEIKTDGYINLNFDKNNNVLYAKNIYQNDFEDDIIYVSSSEPIKSYTGNKKFFFGSGDINSPDALNKISLNNENSLGNKTCIAYEIEIEIESFSEKEISFILGADENLVDCKHTAYKYNKMQNCKQELNLVKNNLNNLFSNVQVKTPYECIDILLNYWIPYQTLKSRMIGKSGFYQSGGAYGFRDQLQDSIGMKFINPEILKSQIILHSKHQFIEGDVEHWWHEETGRGIRTKFSDDLLWLPYAVAEYINFTGDESILDIETSYLMGNLLGEKDEWYDLYKESNIKETIYKHCIKAIEKSIDFGEHGLPKIGSGDWNDAYSKVGSKGKGESIWLGFFLYKILGDFIDICKFENDMDLSEKYEEIRNKLKKSLNTSGWDGRWYRRAYMDDGNILGSIGNDECRIDSIAQSWSVISNAGDNDKKYISMESLENHLIDRENGIIKLLDPPFEKGNLEPGYIKAYLPGVRENGGQYTHGAIWSIIAFAILGQGDKATELFKMINPIEHSKTKLQADKYKVEPYVIAADIYGKSNLAGRGGWTWYTGSSAWYYTAGIEYLLGLKIRKGNLSVEPCIPKDWKQYNIRYKFGESIYNIKVKNINGKNTGVEKFILNGQEIKEKMIKLINDGKINEIEIIM